MPRDDIGSKPRLNIPQHAFLTMPHKYRAYVAGFGSGKTWVGCTDIGAHFYRFPRLTQGYFAPTYPHIRDIFYPTIEEVAQSFGARIKINESNKEVHWYHGRWYYGTVICRSMERPESIVGFKIANAVADELDVMKTDKARRAWRKIIARMRYKVDGVLNRVSVTTTPEGFNFVYDQFVEQVRRKPELAVHYGLIQAATFDNAKNLPDDYIPSLLASYPTALINAYLRGQFVNLTQGSVYPSFDRVRNATTSRIEPGEALHIGMDFNIQKMAGIVHVIRNGRPLALDELIDLYDTPAMIAEIKRRYPNRNISVYPDASGENRKTNASETDISLLRGAGFHVVKNPANPRVRDRILCMNSALERGYWINPDTCPRYTESLEKQAYDEKGEPDKSAGFDHPNDAGGYFITKQFPIAHNRVQLVKVQGQ